MRDALNEIARLADKATTAPATTELPGVLIIKGEVPEHQLAAIYEPMIGFIVQGRKTISIGDDVVDLKAPAYFVVPTDLPATGRVHQGPNGLPYLSVALRLNHNALVDLLKDLPPRFLGREKFHAILRLPCHNGICRLVATNVAPSEDARTHSGTWSGL